MLTLQFESTDPEALRAIGKESKPAATKKSGRKALTASPPGLLSENQAEEVSTDSQHSPSTDNDVILKPQPAANPNSPSTVAPPTPTYMRTLQKRVDKVHNLEIWRWMLLSTSGKNMKAEPGDQALQKSIDHREELLAEKREQSRSIAQKVKNEKSALTAARKAADDAALESAQEA